MAYNWLGADFVPHAVTYALSFIALLIGSVTDIKTREVPDWLNYGMVISGITLNLLFSVIYSNSSFIINSIIGLSIFFGVAYIMFYAGQWGGGDSKMLMGIGAMLGINISFSTQQFLAAFFINALLAGAVYGLLWSIFLVFKNKQRFIKELNKLLSKSNIVKLKKLMLIVLILLLVFLLSIELYYIKILIFQFQLMLLL